MKHIVLFFYFLVFVLVSCQKPSNGFTGVINKNYGSLFIELSKYDEGRCVRYLHIPFGEINDKNSIHAFDEGLWTISAKAEPLHDRQGAYMIHISGTLDEGNAENVSLGLCFKPNSWSTENYVLMPGAAYNGNRYRSSLRPRGVSTEMAMAANPGEGPLQSSVPRLSLYPYESKLQQLSGDMSTPAVGYHDPERGKGIFFLTSQGNYAGDYGFKVWEKEGHNEASITIMLPGVREDSVFKGSRDPFYASEDRGAYLVQGEKIELECKIYLFDSPDIHSLFDYFAHIRKDIGEDDIPDVLPFSEAWKILESKYNEQNWVEQFGYYSVGMRESMYQDWQTGWTGGMNAVYPLITDGAGITRSRAMRTFDFLFDTISPSGLFYEVFYDGKWYLTEESSFLRRNSDALYFILKSFNHIKLSEPDFIIPGNWLQATRGSADAYVSLWEKNGEFGQWVRFPTGDISVPGTSGNGIAPAALVLCSRFFNDKKYLEVARASAEMYYQHYVAKGITNGGPGDIFQGIDSESAFGLLESFVVLYDETGEGKWLSYAEAMAKQCASWVVSYNFRFPESSTFAKMDMKTNGTVIANVQNKHAAPGICTLSGNSLFKLYRSTGEKYYLELIRDIAKSIPQYMSREDRPIPDTRPEVTWPVLPPGWINERVNLSDWEERGNPGDIRRGEVFGGSTWSEVAFLNTYAEIPGIYILKDQQEITVFDHLEAKFVHDTLIEIKNPTKFPASVKIFMEESGQQKIALTDNYMNSCRIVDIMPEGVISIDLKNVN